jgi:hypothetical protein
VPHEASQPATDSGHGFQIDGTYFSCHEWGHAFALAQETSGEWETMYPRVDRCSTYWRTLGNGDWNGMKQLYGLR